MFNILSLVLTVALAAPGGAPGAAPGRGPGGGSTNCPPDVGQIKWSGVQFGFSGPGGRYDVDGQIWDRDRDGKPSNGDLLKIDEARHKGQPLSMNPTWVVLKGGLAKDVAAAFARNPPDRATCESRFEVEDVPTMTSGDALATRLRGLSGFTVVSPEDQARNDLSAWAAETCRNKSANIKRADLQKRVLARGRATHRSLGDRTLKALADEVTQTYAMECGQLDVQKRLTFE